MRCFLIAVVLLWIPMAVQAQIYKCTLPNEPVVYSDRKCAPKNARIQLQITDNVMDGIGSTRDADAAALIRERLANSARVQVQSDEIFIRALRDGEDHKNRAKDETQFMMYSPLLGPGMAMKQF